MTTPANSAPEWCASPDTTACTKVSLARATAWRSTTASSSETPSSRNGGITPTRKNPLGWTASAMPMHKATKPMSKVQPSLPVTSTSAATRRTQTVTASPVTRPPDIRPSSHSVGAFTRSR